MAHRVQNGRGMKNRNRFRPALFLAFAGILLLAPSGASAGPAYSKGVKKAVQKTVGKRGKVTFRSSQKRQYKNSLSPFLERRSGTFRVTQKGKTVASGKLDFQVTKKNNVKLIDPKKAKTADSNSAQSQQTTRSSSRGGRLNAEQSARSLQPGYRSGNVSTRSSYLSNYGYNGRWGHGRYRTR
jgi:hypothetical protein